MENARVQSVGGRLSVGVQGREAAREGRKHNDKVRDGQGIEGSIEWDSWEPCGSCGEEMRGGAVGRGEGPGRRTTVHSAQRLPGVEMNTESSTHSDGPGWRTGHWTASKWGWSVEGWGQGARLQ